MVKISCFSFGFSNYSCYLLIFFLFVHLMVFLLAIGSLLQRKKWIWCTIDWDRSAGEGGISILPFEECNSGTNDAWLCLPALFFLFCESNHECFKDLICSFNKAFAWFIREVSKWCEFRLSWIFIENERSALANQFSDSMNKIMVYIAIAFGICWWCMNLYPQMYSK